jgi:ligand-binding sensor domain-containing protein
LARALHAAISDSIQDDQGFLWFGTQDGLKRYDGYQFREYRYQEGTPNDLSGTSVTALFKDRAGFVWVGSDRYLDRYDPRTERFTAYASDAHGSGIFDGGVNQITQDADGAIWLSTTEELCRLDLPTGRGVRYHHRAGDSASLSSSHVKSTLRGK